MRGDIVEGCIYVRVIIGDVVVIITRVVHHILEEHYQGCDWWGAWVPCTETFSTTYGRRHSVQHMDM